MWKFFVVSLLLAPLAHAEELSGFLKAWKVAESKAGDFHVAFQQQVSSPALAKPVSAPGRLWRFADGSFRWEVGQPVKTMLIRVGDKLRYWEAAGNQWKDINAGDRRFQSWTPFIGGEGVDEDLLSRDFEVSLSEAVLTLKPKSGMAKRHLKHIQLRFDKSTMRLRELLVAQADGGSTTMRFETPQKADPSSRNAVLGVQG